MHRTFKVCVFVRPLSLVVHSTLSIAALPAIKWPWRAGSSDSTTESGESFWDTEATAEDRRGCPLSVAKQVKIHSTEGQ